MKYVLYGEGEEGDNSIHTGFVSRIGVYIVTGALAVATGCATPSQSRTTRCSETAAVLPAGGAETRSSGTMGSYGSGGGLSGLVGETFMETETEHTPPQSSGVGGSTGQANTLP